jgi:ribosomal protein S12 methylthiotransferase accessory factor
MKALFEVSQMLYRFSGRQPSRPTRIRTLDDHADLYASPGGDALLWSAIRRGKGVRLLDLPSGSNSRPGTQLAGLTNELSKVGLEVLVLDLTPADVADAGYHVVRVVVPGAMDINFDARYPRLGSPRLYDLPVKLGLRSSPLGESELNPLPVPLA